MSLDVPIFKVGDRVRYTATEMKSLYNKEGTITWLGARHHGVKFDGIDGEYTAYDINLELLPNNNAFNPGDRVIYVGYNMESLYNKQGTVTECTGYYTKVLFDCIEGDKPYNAVTSNLMLSRHQAIDKASIETHPLFGMF